MCKILHRQKFATAGPRVPPHPGPLVCSSNKERKRQAVAGCGAVSTPEICKVLHCQKFAALSSRAQPHPGPLVVKSKEDEGRPPVPAFLECRGAGAAGLCSGLLCSGRVWKLYKGGPPRWSFIGTRIPRTNRNTMPGTRIDLAGSGAGVGVSFGDALHYGPHIVTLQPGQIGRGWPCA